MLCLPLPLTPAKGFSCSRQAKPWRSATLRISSIMIWLWSQAMFELANTLASSYWPGAASLCSVLAGTPRAHSSSSSSRIKARTRSLMLP